MSKIKAEEQKYSGYFITFEGPEGGGKTSIIRKVRDYLIKGWSLEEEQVVLTREPGGTFVGEAIRQVILTDEFKDEMDEKTRLFLFLGARNQHVRQLIAPALKEGKIVLCDRFSDSTIAYQGHAMGMGCGRVADLSLYATDGILPDLTILLDIPVEKGLERKRKLGDWNVLDGMPVEQHQKIAKAFKTMARSDTTGRWEIVNADSPFDVVFGDVRRIIESRIVNLPLFEGNRITLKERI